MCGQLEGRLAEAAVKGWLLEPTACVQSQLKLGKPVHVYAPVF